jgi:hypothetical protein
MSGENTPLIHARPMQEEEAVAYDKFACKIGAVKN